MPFVTSEFLRYYNSVLLLLSVFSLLRGEAQPLAWFCVRLHCEIFSYIRHCSFFLRILTTVIYFSFAHKLFLACVSSYCYFRASDEAAILSVKARFICISAVPKLCYVTSITDTAKPGISVDL